uniref:Secreted protein n=1 Tax=Setaria viridis TaxID=4556 RepID=A0A4V6D7I4_SETVI|nr:hypothetical protein SEVIR_5G406250v2 [Setaria viridis]
MERFRRARTFFSLLLRLVSSAALLPCAPGPLRARAPAPPHANRRGTQRDARTGRERGGVPPAAAQQQEAPAHSCPRDMARRPRSAAHQYLLHRSPALPPFTPLYIYPSSPPPSHPWSCLQQMPRSSRTYNPRLAWH